MATWNDDVDVASMADSWRADTLGKMARSKHPIILTECASPGNIVACNQAWNKLCGFSPEEALGQPTTILQGKLTSRQKARQFAAQVQANKIYSGENGFASSQAVSSVKLVNYNKGGRAFVHCLKAWRVMDEDTGTEYYMTESHEECDSAINRAMLMGDEESPNARRKEEMRGAAIYLTGLLLIFIPTLYPLWGNLVPRLA